MLLKTRATPPVPTTAHLSALAVDQQEGLAAAHHQLAQAAVGDGVARHPVRQLHRPAGVQHTHHNGARQAFVI